MGPVKDIPFGMFEVRAARACGALRLHADSVSDSASCAFPAVRHPASPIDGEASPIDREASLIFVA